MSHLMAQFVPKANATSQFKLELYKLNLHPSQSSHYRTIKIMYTVVLHYDPFDTRFLVYVCDATNFHTGLLNLFCE